MGERNSYPTTTKSRGFSFMHLLFRFCLFICASYFAEYVAQTNLCVTDDAQIHSSSDLVELPFTRELLISETASFKTARRSRNRWFLCRMYEMKMSFVLHRRTIYETQNQILVKCRSTWSPINSQAPGSPWSLLGSWIILPARSFSSLGSNL